MATCYGRVTGPGSGATRTGNRASGITATVQTWDGALTLFLAASGEWTLYRHDPTPHGHHVYDSRRAIASGSVNPANAADNPTRVVGA